MTEVQAAIGRSQLKRLPKFIDLRQRIYSIYEQAGLNLIDSSVGLPVRYRTIMRTNIPTKIISALKKENIQAIIPIEEYELLDNPKKYPIAKLLANTTVSLPAYPELYEQSARMIAEIVNNVK